MSSPSWEGISPGALPHWGMAEWDAGKSAWIRGYCDRLKRARIDAGYETREKFAEAIRVPKETYTKYENRSPLPAWLIPRVCKALQLDSWFLLTGRSIQDHLQSPGAAPGEEHPQPVRRRGARR